MLNSADFADDSSFFKHSYKVIAISTFREE